MNSVTDKNYKNEDNSIRGSSITSSGQNMNEHIALNKQHISPVNGFNNGKKTKTEDAFENINGDIDFSYLENYDDKENFILSNLPGANENDSQEQKFALILILFSLTLFIGIYYLSLTNIKTEITTLNVPIIK